MYMLGKSVSGDLVEMVLMAKFEICKMFDANRMPNGVRLEVCDEVGNATAVRVFLTGYDGRPLTRAWLLENGAEESDEFVYVWVEW